MGTAMLTVAFASQVLGAAADSAGHPVSRGWLDIALCERGARLRGW